MVKACKAFGVNTMGFEHEILDMILHMEHKRQLQLNKQKSEGSSAKKSQRKGERELERLKCGLNYDGMAKEDRGSWNVRGLNEAAKRSSVKSLMGKWKSRHNLPAGDKNSRLVVTDDSTDGWIVILWDKRLWDCIDIQQGSYTLSCMLESSQEEFRWCFKGVYGPHSNPEKRNYGLNLQFESERYNCIRRSKVMKSFSDTIQNLNLNPPPFTGCFLYLVLRRIFYSSL
ncbi:hypothetical protein H5410_008628 [Solanum commersonii]|uniref:Uncharacterized protein n=1 Tax=Solanum commersonii TaxID=4109 RepID=A0A9J6AH57_SOLCO|nr:hypothetical protein H5410_008628 [Solanum commersonii]